MTLPPPSQPIISDLVVAAPGRINLIGEHTDYNMGFVLPAAINKTISLGLQKRNGSRKASFFSHAANKGFEVSLDAISRSKNSWENYLLGVVYEIGKRTDKLGGFHCHIESTLPTGSGLSSSAALECGLAYGLNELYGLGLSSWDLIHLSREAEHHYVGTQCGIMDQFASVMGKEGHCMLLDCRSLEFSYHPLETLPYKLLLLNSHVSHSLADSEYNLRRMQCEQGLGLVQKRFPDASSLRDVSREMLTACRHDLPELLFARCDFILAENERVLSAAKTLEQGNLEELGRLFYSSHEGLQNRYEVSCPELDFLVDFTKKIPEVLGARMMGGGFGGCTINLVHEGIAEDFLGQITRAYRDRYGLMLTSFEGIPSQGVHLL